MNEIKKFTYKGGARIGTTNATWPFARLYFQGNEIKISNGWHTCTFKPEDVVSITFYEFFSPGIKITHNKNNYPSNVIFWSFKADQILQDINSVGFIPKAEPFQSNAKPSTSNKFSLKDSFSFKLLPSSLLLSIVTILFVLDFSAILVNSHSRIYAFFASLLILLTSISIIKFRPMQKLFLTTESALQGVKPVLFLVIVISVLMLIGFLPSFY